MLRQNPGTPRPTEGLRRHLKARTDTKLNSNLFLLLLVLQPIAPRPAPAAEPPPPKLNAETQEAFERYVHLTEARNENELKRGTALLWVDGLPEEQRAEAYAALKRGELKMRNARRETQENAQRLAVALEAAEAGAYEIDHVARTFWASPEFLRFRRHKFITVVLDTEHDVDYFHDGPARAHSRSSAVRIAEVENAGKSEEREKTPGDDNGFLWRMETWWRMEERDGGVYVQSEVASLTRGIPTGLGWMIAPFVTSIPKESLTFTLQATRKAVRQENSPKQ